MIKTIVIGVFLAVMLGWAFYDAFDQENAADTKKETESANESETSPANEFELQEEGETEEEETQRQSTSLQTGDQAPDFELETLDGGTISLSDLEGQPVLINFWATWCPPCRAEMPDMQSFYEQNDNIEIIAVNLTQTESNQSTIESFVDELNLTFPILLDKDILVADQYNIQPLPTSYFLDSDGIIRHINIGPMNEDMMINELDKLE